MSKREMRRGVAEVRASTSKDGKPGVTLHAIKPGVVDDYGSVWKADAFDESLAKRMPVLAWSHDWSDPLGPATGYRVSPEGPEIDFVFSDFDAVPSARRAHAQVADGTIVDCSVGFSGTTRRDPTDDERAAYPGAVEIIERATLDEVSLVMKGAVPGAKVLSVRSSGMAIDDLVEIARRRNAGELTADEADEAVRLLAVATGEQPVVPVTSPAEPDPDPLPSDADLLALADGALGRSAPRW